MTVLLTQKYICGIQIVLNNVNYSHKKESYKVLLSFHFRSQCQSMPRFIRFSFFSRKVFWLFTYYISSLEYLLHNILVR
jgi:hypothetical protein